MSSAKPDCQRRELTFAGRVQGVGFRYTTRQIAERFAVQGYVQNLPDGRVRLVVEGATAELDAFLQQVQAELRRFITSVQTDVRQPTAEFSSFHIQH